MRAPTTASTPKGRNLDNSPIPDLVSGRPRGRSAVRLALVATLGGLVAFLLIQTALAAHNAGVAREAIDLGWLEPSPFDRVTWASRLSTALPYGAVSYLVLSLAGSAIAGRGHRLLFGLPALALIFVPVLPSPHQPHAIGLEWVIQCYAPVKCSWPWFAHPWVGAFVDLALVLVPGGVVGRSVPARRWPGSTDVPVIAAILTAAATAGTAWWALAAIRSYVDPAMLGTVAGFGLVLGVTRPWWPWLHVVFAAFAFGFFGLMLDLLLWPDPSYGLGDALPYALGELWPIVAVGLIASAWQPLAWAIRKLQARPLRLVIAVNVLNVVDAVMTSLAVRSGGAFEANPIVRLVGLPAKVVLVGLLTWLLYRRKPSALVWPFGALLCVAGYHVAGIFVNGWR
jgi:Domain of unknown function (DUF5658)